MIAIILLVPLGILAWTIAIFRMQKAAFWHFQILAFEQQDRRQPPKAGDVLFIGSSSIRNWKTLEQDMAPLRVINRGFGGAHISHVSEYLDRIVVPYKPRAIVLYAGENDLGWPNTNTAKTVCEDFKKLVERVHSELPGTRIYFISIKPSLFRLGRCESIRTANRLIHDYASSTQDVVFTDVIPSMLDANGKIRADVLPWYRLHMKPKGYELWTSIIKPILARDLAEPPHPSEAGSFL